MSIICAIILSENKKLDLVNTTILIFIIIQTTNLPLCHPMIVDQLNGSF